MGVGGGGCVGGERVGGLDTFTHEESTIDYW